jgi:hypothetical protein
MQKTSKFESAVAELNRDPTTANWEAFAKALKKSNAKYYRTVYMNDKIDRLKDLKDSYVVLHDSRYRVVAKVPVYRKLRGGEIEGALAYLAGLQNANMVN